MNKEELLYEIATKNNELIEKNNKIIELQEIRDKVIEYIKENSHKTEWGDLEQDNESIDINDDVTETEFIEGLLEILKGDSNE